MVPKDEDELADMMYTAMLHEGPSAIRYPRGTGPGVAVKELPVALEIGQAEVIRRRLGGCDLWPGCDAARGSNGWRSCCGKRVFRRQ